MAFRILRDRAPDGGTFRDFPSGRDLGPFICVFTDAPERTMESVTAELSGTAPFAVPPPTRTATGYGFTQEEAEGAARAAWNDAS